jgi:hypothetical protein
MTAAGTTVCALTRFRRSPETVGVDGIASLYDRRYGRYTTLPSVPPDDGRSCKRIVTAVQNDLGERTAVTSLTTGDRSGEERQRRERNQQYRHDDPEKNHGVVATRSPREKFEQWHPAVVVR